MIIVGLVSRRWKGDKGFITNVECKNIQETMGNFGGHFIELDGYWGPEGIQVSIVNLYAPCDTSGNKRLSKESNELLKSKLGVRWCVMRYFNEISK